MNSDVLFVEPTTAQQIKYDKDDRSICHTLNRIGAKENKYYIIVPVNIRKDETKVGGTHWSLLVFSRDESCWYHFDSLDEANKEHAKELVDNMDWYLNTTNSAQAELIEVICTKQDNGHECGAYVMMYGEIVARRAKSGEKLNMCTVKSGKAARKKKKLYDLIRLEIQNDTTEDKKEEIEKEYNDIMNLNKNKEQDVKIPKTRKNNSKEMENTRRISKVCEKWDKDECEDGEECINQHPPRCKYAMKIGHCWNEGNNKCKYYHPNLCWDNIGLGACK